MELGKRIAELRKSRGMTQEQLGERLGASRQAVSKWEAGKATPELDLIIKMGEVFGVTLDGLILGRTAPPEAEAAGGPPQEPPQKTEREGGKRNGMRILFIVLSAVGFGILCLCPLFAELYKGFKMETAGSAFTNAAHYLWVWPIKWVVILGVVFLVGGIMGVVIQALRESEKEEEEL